jgi:hypothetical protein
MVANSKTIVVWGGQDILSSSIEFLCSAHDDWKVVSISNKQALDALFWDADATQPDIVIIHHGNDNEPAKLPLQFLQDHPAIKVITISLENNAMEIFSAQRVVIEQASDLIAVIENELESN